MGKKRTSTRTLPSGEKVEHRPDGTQHLIAPPAGSLRERLAEAMASHREQAVALREEAVAKIEAKRADQADKGLLPEKSPI